MKDKIKKLPKKIFVLCAAGMISVLGILFIEAIEHHLQRKLLDQRAAEAWSDKKDAVQISVFYAENEVTDKQYFKGIGNSIDTELTNAAITSESPAAEARLWKDTISREGKITLTNDKGKQEIHAIGVEGDFFSFHPLQLVSGTYFSPDNLMQDGVIIDEETAWQLFGSNDIAGMEVRINDVYHMVIGVYSRPKDRISGGAGMDKSICFLSLDSLEQYGSGLGGYNYEIVMPNPIKGFGLSLIKKVINAEETDAVIVENSTRYDIFPLYQVSREFGLRSMSKQGIVYPYWENVARGYEDYFAVLLIIKTIFMCTAIFVILSILVFYYRRKTWSIETIVEWLKDKHYESGTKRNIKKEEKRREKEGKKE